MLMQTSVTFSSVYFIRDAELLLIDYPRKK